MIKSILLSAFLFLAFSGFAGQSKTVHVVSNKDNDLVKIIKEQKNIITVLHNKTDEAVKSARKGEGILVLADSYPGGQVKLENSFWEQLRRKKLRAYVEFPSNIPGVKMGEIEKANLERAVVSSKFFSGFPDSLGILGINGLHYISITSPGKREHIVAAKVAGFDSAIYGLPKKQSPLLFELDEYRTLVSTTNFSRFISGRYAPEKNWEAIWTQILKYVLPEAKIQPFKWNPVLSASYSQKENLPGDFQRKSIFRGIEWYKNARMLIPDNYADTLRRLVDSKIQLLPWNRNIPLGDGSNGLFECIFSKIDEKGSQPIGIMERGDCVSETSMAFAAAGLVFGDKKYMSTSQNLLDYYLFKSIALKSEYANPAHAAYGLIPWGISNNIWYKVNYGDDNARFLLAAWTTAALTGSDRWDETMMKSLLALLRTTGKNGFRGSRIDLPALEKNGWRYYFDSEIINPSPHFECYLWACYLWAYDKTGETLFLDRASKGIRTMMDLYPEGWRWTNGLAQEKARMILPLAWLVRINNSPENRKMLMTVVNDLLKLQDECGAIREELGSLKMGKYPPPQSNQAYGTTEASLIARNGDSVTDLLYTTNFAFLGLHEAYYATKDPEIQKAVNKLAEFLCRIQVASSQHPELDGGWMRAFDYKRYEHWGSNADHGWGAWAIETGWTQGWITTILALRELNTSVWDLTKSSQVARYYSELKVKLLPQN